MRQELRATNWQGFGFYIVLLRTRFILLCICMLTYTNPISNYDWHKISPDLWSWTSLPLGEWILFFLVVLHIHILFKKLEVFNEEWTRFNIHILIRMFFAWYNIYNIYIRKTVFLQALQEWGEGVRSFPSAGNPRGPQTVWICWWIISTTKSSPL